MKSERLGLGIKKVEKKKEMVNKRMTLRQSYEERFGKKQAEALVTAAEMHRNGVHDNKGNDPFAWAVLIALGYQCVELYSKHHGITVSFEDFQQWCLDNVEEFKTYDGDFDYLGAMTGAYDFLGNAMKGVK